MYNKSIYHTSKKKGKKQESIQSSNTPDTTWERTKKKTTRKHHTQENQEVSSFLAGNLKAAMNNQDSMTDTNANNKTAPKKKHRLGMVSKNILTGELKLVLWYQPHHYF